MSPHGEPPGAMRTQLEESLSHTIKNLSKMHDERHR
jgi:hypothetical protein